ncbi:MMPL family transporter [Nocardia sp. NPDC024068]|uniref:MMPL family transporter n=1 Tax=Nocardia sp. NPDC024068 TaxID=3157197 RepID=UPI0033FC339B
MFTRWGDLVYRLRFAVIGVVVAGMLGLGGFGLGLADHLSSSGLFDPGSESVEAAEISDESFGRDHNADVLVLYTAPEGQTVDSDPAFRDKIVDSLNRIPREHPDQIAKVNGAYWKTETGEAQPAVFGSKDKTKTFASIAIVGDNDDEMVRNYRAVKDVFFIDGVNVQVAGLQPVAGTLNDTMAHDTKRMELLAIPAVGVLLFFIFGGVVAAGLPLIVGGLTILAANGILMMVTKFTEVNTFVGAVVSMIGLGLAIDYGLFIVSRFREELAEGYDTPAAVRRSVMTAGRTVVFSATMIIASLGGLLLFPQGFLKSMAYGTIATVAVAALASITLLPAMLSVLGPRVDMLSFKKMRKTKSAEEVEASLWGRITTWVMRHPLKIAIPICVGLLLLIIPVKNLAFGGMSEKYLPPDNTVRIAQEEFDQTFPLRQSDPIQLIFISEKSSSIGKVLREVDKAPGLADAGGFAVPSQSPNRPDVFRTEATLLDSDDYRPTVEYLRAIDVPDDVTMLVGGQPTLQGDSIDALVDRIPLMIAVVLLVTTVLMFLTFGSLVLPIKAALMSVLGLGSTLGILTWIFVDGNGADLLNFTPQPIMSPVLVLIIAIIYGLSTDYEVFLLSRMVEARAQGASTTEAVRIGTAHTGRIITAAALILLVVTGAFAFSDLVMMQYIAYGMIAALIIDATILRMLLVPATMKLLGDDCWWAPAWMKRIQQRIGLGEPLLENERPGGGDVVDLVKTTPVTDPVTMQMPALTSEKQRKTPVLKRSREEIEAGAPTTHLEALPKSGRKGGDKPRSDDSAPAAPKQPMPTPPDPTRPRANPPATGSGEPGRSGEGTAAGSRGGRPPADTPRPPARGPQPFDESSRMGSGAPQPGSERGLREGAEPGPAGLPGRTPEPGRIPGATPEPGRPGGAGHEHRPGPSGRTEAGRTPNPLPTRPGPNQPGPQTSNQPASTQSGPPAPNQPGPPAPGRPGPAAPSRSGPSGPGRSGPAAPGRNTPAGPPQAGPPTGRPGFATPTLRGMFASEPTDDEGGQNATGRTVYPSPADAPPVPPTPQQARLGGARQSAPEGSPQQPGRAGGRPVGPARPVPPRPPAPEGRPPARPGPQPPGSGPAPDPGLRRPPAPPRRTGPNPVPGQQDSRSPQDQGSQPRPMPRISNPGNATPGGQASGLPELPRRVPGAQPPEMPGQYRLPEPPTRPAQRPTPPAPRPDSLADQSAEPPEPQQNPDGRERNSIESWMAGLRSARRQQAGTPAEDTGRHQHGEGRSVSVNELLRRRDQD